MTLRGSCRPPTCHEFSSRHVDLARVILATGGRVAVHSGSVHPDVVVRPYVAADEEQWLRCRVLSFLHTAFFDDVAVRKRDRDAPVQLVAVDADDHVLGQLDATVDGTEACLENIAVHPDHHGRGIGTTLLAEAVRTCRELGADTLTAWTRDDGATVRWYSGRGFEETLRYLHVYVSSYSDDLPAGLAEVVRHHTDTDLVSAFFHAPLDAEAELRAAHRRVHVDRSLVLQLGSDVYPL